VAAELDDVGVGAGGARGAPNLNGNFLALGCLLQALENAWINVWSTEESRTGPHLGLAYLLLVVAGRVRGVADIDGNSDGRMDAIGAGGGAAQADLLLNRGHAKHRRLERSAVQQAQRLHNRPHTN